MTSEQAASSISTQADEQVKGRAKKPTFDPEYITDISEKVYRANLNRDSGNGAPERMIEKDGDGGVKFRHRAAAYDKLTRTYLAVLGFEPSKDSRLLMTGRADEARE